MEKRKIYQILRKFFIENLSFFRYNNDKNIINLFFRFVNVFLRKRGVRLCEHNFLTVEGLLFILCVGKERTKKTT